MSKQTLQVPKSSKITRRQKDRRGHKRGTSEVGKFFHSLLRPEEAAVQKKYSHKKFRSLRLDTPSRELDAEALTKEERLSRLLHTPKPQIKLPDFGSLFDHFLVVGVPDHLTKSPKILFRYPIETPVNIPGLPDFCFPSGVNSREFPDSITSKNEMIALLHNQQYLKRPENSFVFLFTNEQSQVYYGICFHKEEVLESPPQYMNEILVPLNNRSITTRCFCLVTRFPFFRFHFDFLFSLFAVEHLARLESEAPSILEEKEEIEVFLSPSQEKLMSKSCSTGTLIQESIPIRLDDTPPSFQIDHPEPEELPAPLLEVIEDKNVLTPKTRRCNSSASASVTPEISGKLSASATSIPTSQKAIPGLIGHHTNHPCIEAMGNFKALPIPAKGRKIEFQSSEYLNPISFSRPFLDEEEELFAEWGLPITLSQLSFETLCDFLSAILLEKKILVYAKSLRILSGIVLAFPPLIKPFSYQSVIIPMLPDKMENFLEAPVPFVVGTTRDPSSISIPEDVVILDSVTDSLIFSESVPPLPRYEELERKCSSFIQELLSSFGGEIPYRTTKLQKQLVDSICTVFETHFDSLFANFHNYTICNMSDPLTPISVFMKDSFLDDIEEDELPFIEPFISSQAFFEYSDHRLRKRDNA